MFSGPLEKNSNPSLHNPCCWLVSPVTTLSRAKWLLCWYKHHHLPPHCKLSTWKHSAIWRRLSTILADSARQASIGSDVFVFKCRLFISSSLPCCWLYLESFKRPLPLPIPGPGGDHGANWPLVVGVLGSVVWLVVMTGLMADTAREIIHRSVCPVSSILRTIIVYYYHQW